MEQIKKRNKLFGVVLCSVFLLTSCLPIEVSACTKAYYDWTWDNSINMKNLSIRVYSSNFADTVSVEALNAWNMITPIFVHYVNYGSNITSGNIETINVHEKDLTGTTIGQTHLYRKGSIGQYVESSISSSNKDICQARIYLDSSLLNTTDAKKAKTITHELGHAFGMMHPIINGCEVECIMQQNKSGFASTEIKQHDKNNMIAKWGAFK